MIPRLRGAETEYFLLIFNDSTRFNHSIPEAERKVTLVPCARCAAGWYAEAAASVMAEAEPPRSTSDDVQLDAVAPRAGQPHAFFRELQELMRWHSGGKLSEEELKNAKQKLGP